MIIDFYHIDAFEVANYEPIWRKLREMGVAANLVAVRGNENAAEAEWFDFERFHTYCTERNMPYSTQVTPHATLGVTTQNANILRDYQYKVRLMYGPVVYPAAWALQPHSVQLFDAVLTHGKSYADRFSNWLPREQLPIIGYPRYDDLFAGKINRNQVRERWGIHNNLPVLVFLPTWENNTAFDQFFPALLQLADKYQIVLRPHHCTLRMEQNRMDLMRASGFLILDNAFDLSEVYIAADVILADVRSGGLFEACLCDVPTVGMVMDPAEISGWLAQNHVEKMVTLCSDPNQLENAIQDTLTSKTQTYHRNLWAEQHVACRNGNSAQSAAEALISLERLRKQSN